MNDSPVETHLLGVETERMVRVHQAVLIYDSTALLDSLNFAVPPTNRIYQWKITPADNAVTFSDHYKNGRAVIIFGHSGNYQVSAYIYDSLDNHLIGHTNAVTITVTKDTLYPTQPLDPADTLMIRSSLFSVSRNNVRYNGVQLILSTVKSYDFYDPYVQFAITSHSGKGNFSFVISDSLTLTSYPFAYGYGVREPALGTLDLIGMDIGVPAGLSITWLDKTYTGRITMLSTTSYNINWDNSGAVRISP